MTQRLILVRHGNTFEADQTPTFVGARTDLPLTAKGEEQGHAIAALIASDYAPVEAVISGPLLRTRRFGEIIGAQTQNAYSIDERLREVDYGLWENQTSAAVRAEHGDALVDAWEKDGVWPVGMGWSPSLDVLKDNVAAFMAEQHKKLLRADAANRVVVTSNGILRFVFSHITGKPADHEAKVGTGRFCILETTPHGWTIKAWNQKPS